MGGILYSDKFTGKPIQAIEWHKYVWISLVPFRKKIRFLLFASFIGSNAFCLKACDPAGANATHYCEHIFDRIGCAYNAPNNAQRDVFESCDGDSQDFPGVYTGADGAVTTYKQPAESLGIITTMPYTARVPASSNCQKFESTSIFAALPKATVTPSSSSSSAASTGTGLAATRSSTGSSASQTGSAQSSTTTGQGESGAEKVMISGLAFLGVVFSAIFLS